MAWPIPDDPDHWNRQRFRRRDDHDVQLAYLIVEELVGDVRVNSQPINVEVQNGVAVLTGTVDTAQTKELVGDIARRVYGVTDVCNALQVPAPTGGITGSRQFHDLDYHSSDHLFQEIIARQANGDRAPDGGIPNARQFRAVLLFLGAVLWGALTSLIIWLGWVGLVLAGAAATVIATCLHHRASRR
ncbi:BON domain-containing protein [Actinoplanes sp. ATCC 53533]|uniref:BON domain-containing protein n=1 Tax=Actinoplanes sp. ATCC 53533 TaxID=1288362 RepID=UPI00131568DA|nr:BON domain-containing protein [Actinoplanes sp. ATCC 53533]